MSMTKVSRPAMLGLTLALGLGALGLDLPYVALSTPAAAKVLAKVNGKEITDEDLKYATEDLASSLPPQLEGKARDSYLLDYLIDAELVAQKAQAEKLDKTTDFNNRLAYFREKLLMEVLLSQVAKGAVTEEALKTAYDEAAKAQKPEQEIHARHILVATDDDAKAVLKRLKAGEDFAKVAKEVSKDPSADGGDLGWFTKDRMVPEFADAAFKLDENQLSEPVKSQFGWHIIQVLGKRQKTFPPYDQVREQVARFVIQRAQGELVAQLRKAAKIEKTEPETPEAAPDAAKPAPGKAPAKK
ncbi:peptidylprolyl isomerase [Beijerinckia indica]|uniref:Parvulin-like PPIase n=1 Tax=Beijerinckia indica subsp. indica (strain ATCC 9039 / DSM 1715 / NCIMB 8712) TaxID=395963 RepID=B2ID50_BEII9|nr:peptidylprolyl isomerase [Beijerinckia indica]ACB96815.1 PpiC-type peptidyl-prolyl cis-trans isomerase [Beijerinckia indica subsp. indica ATCC 9039]